MAFSHYYFAKLGHKRRLKPDLCLIMVISTHTHTHKKCPSRAKEAKPNGMERNGRGTGWQWNGRTLVSWEQARRTISMLNYWFSTLKEKR